jgi:hypothetical protein
VQLETLEHVFAQAKLWRQMYAASGRQKTASTVVPFPDRRRQQESVTVTGMDNVTVTKKIGGRA